LSYDLAWAYYSLGRVAEAENTMQAAPTQAPSFPKAQEVKSFLAMLAAAKDPDQAVQMAAQCDKTPISDPNYVPALVVSALAQEKSGNFKQAAQIYDQVLQRYPLFSPATLKLAILYFERLA